MAVIDVLKAYRARLKKAGRLQEVKTVERCIVLVQKSNPESRATKVIRKPSEPA